MYLWMFVKNGPIAYKRRKWQAQFVAQIISKIDTKDHIFLFPRSFSKVDQIFKMLIIQTYLFDPNQHMGMGEIMHTSEIRSRPFVLLSCISGGGPIVKNFRSKFCSEREPSRRDDGRCSVTRVYRSATSLSGRAAELSIIAWGSNSLNNVPGAN